ncbi:MAG: hypothetical protein ACFFCT_10640 [Candidatus Odinarchaeota archaeon]
MKSEDVVIGFLLLAFVASLFYHPPTFYDIVGSGIPEDTESNISIVQGETKCITVFYHDVWHDLPIEDATVSVNNTDSEVLEIISALPDLNNVGYYNITISGKKPGSASLRVALSKSGYDSQIYTIEVTVYSDPNPPRPPFNYGSPALLLVILCAIYYRKRMITKKQSVNQVANSSESLDGLKNEDTVNEDTI